MSKGSKRRKMSVSTEEFERNWDSIFGGSYWFHECGSKGRISTVKGEECPRCGAVEEKAHERKAG